MNLSRKWLSEFVSIQADDKEYADVMTLAGQKVETTTRLDAEISGVVVGRVLSMERHPDSDHLWICQVDVGNDASIQVVTGAQNVSVNDLVPVALHGACLPGGVRIKKGKLRGVESEGMLCSFGELGLTQNDLPGVFADGIWIMNDEDCPVGEDVNLVIGNDDSIVEFEITNNRPDCYSLIGLARETAAAFNVPMKHHEPVVRGDAQGDLNELLHIEVPAEDLCRRYTARMVRNVKIGPSPKWMRQRLRSAGIRPINNIVDITNYVMVEYGQPMHAFDYRYVHDGTIIVRRADKGETLTTLDGSARNLTPDMLVIADANRAVGLAGIMGGENSEIVEDTTDVVFESANFNGTSIRQTALALGMRTDASAKFEKNIDVMLTLPAVNRACELVEMLGAGEVVDGVIDVINYAPEPVTLTLEPEKINALLGTDIPAADMENYLRRMEVPVENGQVLVPSWRPDLRCMADLAEEVGRLYGFNKIATTPLRGTTTQGGYSEMQKLENAIGDEARGLGYNEIISYSFVSPSSFDLVRVPQDSPLRNCIRIQNPLGEDTSVMRTIALPSMLEILGRNYTLKNTDVKLYEMCRVYLPKVGSVLPDEPKRFLLGAYGESVDFFSLKGEVEALLRKLRLPAPTFRASAEHPSYHPGRCAEILFDGVVRGVMGQIHPLVAQNYGLECAAYTAELDFTELTALVLPEPTFHAIPRFPAVARDLALVCREEVTVGELKDCIIHAAGPLLHEIDLFDIYRGAPIEQGKKSVAFSLKFRAADRTLTGADTDGVMENILKRLKADLDAVIR